MIQVDRLPLRAFAAFAAFAALAALADTPAAAYNWDDIPPEELAATECRFDPGAPAEVLYKEIIYDLGYEKRRVIKTHLRTKIYEQSALDSARRTRFWYGNRFGPAAIHARVIKPDGSYQEINDEDVVSQVERKRGTRTVRSTTISLPNVEVGDIVEYRYRLLLDEGYFLPKDELTFQEEWPIRKLHLKMKPYIPRGSGFKWTSHRTERGMEKGKREFYEITLEDQPGYTEEPYQAPDSDAKSWFAFYNVHSGKVGDAFWMSEAKSLYRRMLSKTKAHKGVEEKARQLTAGMATREEKLKALYDFCVSELVNSVHGEADRLTQDQRDKLNNDWPASKTLENGFGTTRNINTVFCALARAIDIDARLAVCADRSEYAFTKTMENVEIALPHSIVAIPNGDDWAFYNPAAKYVAFGELDWIHDNVVALVPDRKELILVRTGAAPPEANRALTEGNFVLGNSGELSGSVQLTASGNHGLNLKQMLDGQSESARVESVEAVLQRAWPNGQFSEITVANATDPFEPVEISFELTLANYAEAVGQRLFLQPNVEERYAEAEFPSPDRKTPIFFDHKYLDEAHFEIVLPDGYELEAPSAPHPFAIEGFIDYAPKLSVNRAKNALVYERRLAFYGDRYPPEAYPAIKNAFDRLHAQDHHTLTLKRAEPVPEI